MRFLFSNKTTYLQKLQSNQSTKHLATVSFFSRDYTSLWTFDITDQSRKHKSSPEGLTLFNAETLKGIYFLLLHNDSVINIELFSDKYFILSLCQN